MLANEKLFLGAETRKANKSQHPSRSGNEPDFAVTTYYNHDKELKERIQKNMKHTPETSKNCAWVDD